MLAALRSRADIAEAVRRLYGEPPPRNAGTIHPTSVWPAGDGRLVTLRITPETPGSVLDRFVLDVARARADGILTTGRILREERGLTLAFRSAPFIAEALAAWRRDDLGRRRAPVGVVLTRSGDVDLDHPSFHAVTPMVVLTTPTAAARLRTTALEKDVTVVSHAAPSAAAAIAYLRDAHDAGTISIEAGPTTSRPLYGHPPLVDELLLTTYLGAVLSPRVAGPDLLDLADLRSTFSRAGPATVVSEPSGRWQFQRYVR